MDGTSLREELDVLSIRLKEDKLVSFLEIENSKYFLNRINESNYHIILHDVENFRPICLNNALKDFYDLDRNWFLGENYLYYLELIHPSDLKSLFKFFEFFRKDSNESIELHFNLQHNKKNWQKVNTITEIVYRTNGGKPKYAITIAENNKSSLISVFDKIEKLTPREKEIIDFISMGYTQKEVAKKMNISYNTVHSHIKNIYTKLKINKVSELIGMIKKYPVL